MKGIFVFFLLWGNLSYSKDFVLAFGSCNNQHQDQSFWKFIVNDRPDVWVWLGDNIYADYATPKQRKEEYQIVKDAYWYKYLTEQTMIVGTWDDHDYAYNNAQGDYEFKDESKQILGDFLGYSPDSEFYSHDATHSSEIFDYEGIKIGLILLDTRYHMNKKVGQILGEDQWMWLEDKLYQMDADLILLGSSIAVLPASLNSAGLEGWTFFDDKRERLLDLIEESGKKIVILSGDRHYTAFYRISYKNRKGYIYEFMSSGMTHVAPAKVPSPLQFQKSFREKNYGLVQISSEFKKSGKIDFVMKSTEDGHVYQKETVQLN